MDSLILLRDAREAGISVSVSEGTRLAIKAPRAAESLVRQIQEHRPEVIEALSKMCGWCQDRAADAGLDEGGQQWCVTCRDSERRLQAVPPALVAGRDLRAAWAGAVRELGELVGCPELPFKPGHAISVGPIGWQRFAVHASAEDLRLVLDRLKLLVADLPTQRRGEERRMAE